MRLPIVCALALLAAGCAAPADDAFPGDYLASAHPTPDGLALVDDDSDSPFWQSARDSAGMDSNPGRVDLSRLQDQVGGENATLVEAWAAIYEGANDEDGPQMLVAYALRFDDGAEVLDWVASFGCDAFDGQVLIAIDGDRAALLTAIGDSDDVMDGAADLHADILAATGARDPCTDD